MAASAATYELRWRLAGSNGAWNTTSVPATTSTITIPGLERGQQYEGEARAVSLAGTPSAWVPVTWTVANPTLAPRAPFNLTAVSVADGVALHWQQDTDQPADVDYQIQRADASTGPWQELTRVRSLSHTDPVTDGVTRFYRVRAMTFGLVFSAYSNIASAAAKDVSADISTALTTAQNAQATADGKIVSFWQATPPVIGPGANEAHEGDIWFDTDDGNKVYRVVSGAWAVAADDDMAAALAAASDAQATADGKVKTYFQATAPTAEAVGDLWYHTTEKVLYRWNGSAWVATADSSEAAVNALILNGGFEQGSLHWTLETGAYTEQGTNAARSGAWGLVIPGEAGGTQRAYTTRQYPLQAGQQVIMSADIRNLAGTANGNCFIEMLCYDSGGGLFALPAYAQSNVHKNGTSEWKTVANKFTAPPGTASVRFGVVATGHTSGAWCADNLRAFIVDSSAHAPAAGENMISNGNFASNQMGAGNVSYTGAASLNRKIIDNWFVRLLQGQYALDAVTVGLETGQTQPANSRSLFIGDQGGTLTPGVSALHVCSEEKVPVTAGEVLTIEAVGQVDEGSTIPSGVVCSSFFGLRCFDVNGGEVAFIGKILTNHRGTFDISENYTVPSGVVAVRALTGINYDNTTGANVAMGWAVMHQRLGKFMVRRSVTLDQPNIRDGSTYGRTALNDLFVSGGVNRIGLRVAGSGHRIGNQANIVQSLATAYGAVRTTTALSADSAGNVTVNAHTVRYGGFSVSYNGVTNAVTGLTQGVTYAIYCFDDAFAGGTRTWFAATSREAAMNQGDGVVVAGEVTIPTSGSSSGGGGGGMDCVATDMLLPCGSTAVDVEAGDRILCWDFDADNPGERYESVQAAYTAEQHCTRIETESGAAVVASSQTPMTLRDGSMVPIADMAGHLALVRDEFGRMVWEQVVKAEYVGLHPVRRIRVHQHCYFAGERADRTIATHNPVQKP